MPEINLPKYLYKKTSNLSLHVSPYATFDPSTALDGKQAFVSAFSPNQQPQKKQIYLDFKTFYKLWDSENRALIIAKLKKEKFSVFLICQKNKTDKPILAEIDDELELKINNVKKSIFLLNDDDIQGLSSIDHSLAINKLSLAIDDSVILDFAQFKEIGDVLGVNSWVEKGVFKSHLRLSSFKGLEEFEITKTNSLIKKNIHLRSSDTNDFPQMMLNYFQLPDFELEDAEIKFLLNYLVDAYKSSSDNEYYLSSILNDLLKVIYKDNPETVKKIFNYWFEYQFKPQDDAKKIAFQKFLIKSFWFFYPDFSELIDKAKSIDEYSHSSIEQIADSLIQPSIDNLIDLHNQGGFYLKEPDLERLSEALRKHIIDIYIKAAKNPYYHRNKICDFLMIFSRYIEDFKIFVDREKILFTVNGNNIEIYEGYIEELLNNETTNNKFNIDNWIRIKIENLIQDLATDNTGLCDFAFCHDESYTFLCNYFDFLSIQNQEKLIEKLQSLIGNREIPFDNFTTIINKLDKILTNPKIIKKLNISSIIKFFIYNLHHQYSFMYKEYSIIIKLLQHNLEKESDRLDLIKILEKGLNPAIGMHLYFDLTPEFEDLLITLHQERKIDLTIFSFFNSSSIRKKLWLEHSLTEMQNNGPPDYAEVATDFYLANYAITYKQNFRTQLAEVSSQQLNQSPIQFYLVDLNQKSLAEIKDLISKQKIDPSKILSLNILGFNQVELARKLEVEDDSPAIDPNLKQQLLTEVINLFPNLKHLKINKYAISSDQIIGALTGKKITFEAFDYSLQRSIAIPTLPLNLDDHKNTSSIFIANQLSDNKANKSGNSSFTMVEAGKILSRPQTKTHPFLVRDSLSTLKTNCHSLEEDWLPKDNSTRDLQEVLDISKFSIDQFNSFSPDQGLLSTHSFCSFTQDLDSGNNSLLSISPDNEIVGYYTEPDNAVLKFHKNAEGFLLAKCDQGCKISYILKGQELPYKSLKDVSLDLPDSIKKVITDYRGLNPDQFPFAIQETDYQLPKYSDDASIDIQQKNKQWLDQLFAIPNKGACRHRVMAMAHKFQQANLDNGQDFRIVRVNNNHILLEVKNKDDSWITLDLGGSNAQLNYQSGTYQASSVNLDKEKTLQSIDIILTNDITNSNIPAPSPSKTQAKVVDQELQSVQTEIDKLYQLKELNTLNQFQTELLGFIDSQQKSLLLTSLTIEKLKNYLLGFKKTDESISTHFISSPQDMQIQKATIQIQSSEKVSISPTTALLQFIETAKSKPSEKHFLIIEEQEINSSSQASTQLAWLDHKKYSIKYHPKKELEKIPIVREDPACIENQILQNSQQQAQDFITRRKTTLKELLSKNSALQIFGHSGVGKSSLLREVKKTGLDSLDDTSITEELANFEEWASDTSVKTKILVIDEFNVDGSTNFTMFRDLVNAKNDSRKKYFIKENFIN